MGMKAIPPATVIALTVEELKALEALAGSRESEARMRDRARIVLLAASGAGSRAVAREVGARRAPCRSGGCVMPISEWRVSARPAITALSRDMGRSMDGVFSRCWI